MLHFFTKISHVMLVHLKEYTYTSNDLYGHKLMLPAAWTAKQIPDNLHFLVHAE